MKTVGLIGGLGPETTAEFYLELSFGCQEKNKKARPPILIWNVPQNYRIEKEVMIQAFGEDRYIPILQEAARILEKGGADFIAMPCNTLHLFIKEIRQAVKIPVMSIVEETAKFLKKKKVKEVGLLAMPASVKHKLYQKALAKEGIKCKLPTDLETQKIGKMVNKIVLNKHANKERKDIIHIIERFASQGVKHVILACTDLQIMIPHHPKLEVHDSLKIFADATVREILG